LEETIQDRAGCTIFVGEAIGFADLAEDFGLAEEERVESGRDAEKVPDGGAVIVLIEGAIENVWANGMEFAEKGRETEGGFVGGFRRDAVHFAAIAGGENEGFFE
jgi:hypothetical protein